MSENEEIADLKRKLAMVTDELTNLKTQQYEAGQRQAGEGEQLPRERAWHTYQDAVRRGDPPDAAKRAFVHELLHGEGERRRTEEEQSHLERVREHVEQAREDEGGA